MKTIAIVQARMGSTRLPNKVMMAIEGVPMIEILLRRLSKSKELDGIIVATTIAKDDDILESHINNLGYSCARGSKLNVLQRFVDAARKYNATTVVRITGDCPLVDSMVVDEMVARFKNAGVDYLSNISPPTYPDGLDIEVFSSAALERSFEMATEQYDLEHVTSFMRNSGYFTVKNFANTQDFSKFRWTVDELVDLEVIQAVFKHFSPNIFFGWQEVVALRNAAPEVFLKNEKIMRNEGANMGSGQKLWKRAKHVIPGGNMLLSKRSEMFLPEHWPSYYSKAKGCNVWDLDGNKYIDMSIMGVGTNILGYGDIEVDSAVIEVVQNGNMSTFNCPDEVFLAEKLLELHAWADMVRLARTGGEANAVAIRIARAASGKDKVAICGYHGWHDWYLSANLGSKSELDGHLLPGLEPKGVPRNLQGTIFPFEYNNYEQLERLVNEHDIGVIKMEVLRNAEPIDNFLHKVRKLATDKNIVLVFDECTSGFRETFGGIHKKYGVNPDMAIFGKALGNGYAITAIIGRREIMEAAQSTFISSTFWTERIGPAAAIQTLEVMERINSWEKITNTGIDIKIRWEKLAILSGVKINHWGIPALAGYTFDSKNALAYKTLVTQEMLKKGLLASNCIYVSTQHTPEIIDLYFETLEPIFKIIGECESGRDIYALLDGPVCHGGFKRLN